MHEKVVAVSLDNALKNTIGGTYASTEKLNFGYKEVQVLSFFGTEIYQSNLVDLSNGPLNRRYQTFLWCNMSLISLTTALHDESKLPTHQFHLASPVHDSKTFKITSKP